MVMGAVGTRPDLGPTGGVALALTGDAGFARLTMAAVDEGFDDLTASAWRVRGGVEASRTAGSGNATATPFATIVMRSGGGDCPRGVRIESGGGLGLAVPDSRCGLEARGRYLALHGEAS